MPTYSKTLDYLYALKNRGSKYGIERMRLLVDALGHPEWQFPVVHVAGTNGKGSVCAMLEALYRDNGYRTGLFTSPHLVHLGERVQVDRQRLTPAEIVTYTAQLKPIAADLGRDDPDRHPTFFEFMTAMAFLRFAAERVDIACIETGLGGRLDSTNVVEPELSIITTISLDHTEMLGDTLAAIAGEKAGIIKPGKPVLMGRLPAEAEAVVRRVAAERGCPLYVLTERFPDERALPHTNLAGGFQRWNAALAVYATEILSGHFPIQSVAALDRVDWAGRWQEMEVDGRRLILDASHNPEGVLELAKNLDQLIVEAGRPPHIIAGTLGEDRARSLMAVVATRADELYLVAPQQERATPTGFLKSCLARDAMEAEVSALFPQPGRCTVGQPGDAIVLAGSIYLIGEVLEQIQGLGSKDGSVLQDRV
ncbi:MAG: bifunctional folylpolyglutamate synthase/dihydrofolate synthase [Puniceicoccaceae bacterium]|nr:MAG: bifunctional folylpolyglutamate synthase/dihydrofolate synthase [Puniceicoccaceae bacterium]